MVNPRESAAIRLLLEALRSDSLIRSRRHDENGIHYGLGVPLRPQRTHPFDGVPDGFAFQSQTEQINNTFIGFFPLLRKIVGYFVTGIILLLTSMCFYSGT
jgi:hypothetical protein